jgi:hypothetical protein
MGAVIGSIDSLKAIPTRYEYTPLVEYPRTESLSVLAIYPGGVTREISVNDVTITVTDVIGAVGQAFRFETLGEKKFTVRYGGKTAVYSGIVRHPSSGGGGDSDGDDDGTGIDFTIEPW